MSFLSFAMNIDKLLAIRMQLLFVLILASIIFRNAINAHIPKISYLTYVVSEVIDSLMWGLEAMSDVFAKYMMIFSSAFHSGVSGWSSSKVQNFVKFRSERATSKIPVPPQTSRGLDEILGLSFMFFVAELHARGIALADRCVWFLEHYGYNIYDDLEVYTGFRLHARQRGEQVIKLTLTISLQVWRIHLKSKHAKIVAASANELVGRITLAWLSPPQFL